VGVLSLKLVIFHIAPEFDIQMCYFYPSHNRQSIDGQERAVAHFCPNYSVIYDSAGSSFYHELDNNIISYSTFFYDIILLI
jgi:hypothetical protein